MRQAYVTGTGLLLAAIAAAASAAPARAQTAVKFVLDSRIEGPAAPFLLPLDRGYYRAEGLDVAVDTAAATADALARVASGAADIGFADINALIRYRDANPAAPVKAVFMVYNRPPYAIVGRKSRGVARPKDLEGKKLGAPAADTSVMAWRIFAKLNDVDPAKVMVENVGMAVREPMLAAGQVDAIAGYAFTTYVTLKDRGVPPDDIVLMRMADHGVILYGSAIVVNANFASEQPQAVSGFLRAFLKGLKDTVRDPRTAVESVLRRNELAKKDVELERLRMAIKDNIVTPEVRANGFGEVDMERLESAIEQLAGAQEFKARPKAASVFDQSFLPPAAQRKPQ